MINGVFRQTPLGMNLRNRFIHLFNPPDSLDLAKDKARFKELLSANGITVPRTYLHIRDYSELPLIDSLTGDFVVKPDRGHGGNGILVLRREGDRFLTSFNEIFPREKLIRHIRRVLDGDFSGNGTGDSALIEERIFPSPRLVFNNPAGLPNIRVFCYDFKPLMAMFQHPTEDSRGRANLSQGAVGIGIEIKSGTMTHIHTKKGKREFTPDELGIPPDFSIPEWEGIKSTAVKAARLSGLRVAGVDTVLDSNDRVMVLEINGRPGLEIQNINEESLLERIIHNAP